MLCPGEEIGERMDVLKGVPEIDQSRFIQGPVSDPMWNLFMSLVVLCHAVVHWRDSANSLAPMGKPPPVYPRLSDMERERLDYLKKQREDDQERMRELQDSARVLAREQLDKMLVLTAKREGTPDYRLFEAVVRAIGVRFLYRTVALEAFDAATLTNTEPGAIAAVWSLNAGYNSDD